MQSADKKYFALLKGINTEAPLVAWPEGFTIDEQNFDLLIDGSRRRRPGLGPEDLSDPNDTSSNIVLTGTLVQDEAELSWTGYVFDESATTGYEIWRSVDGGAFTLLTTVGEVLTYTDTTIVGNTDYLYYVIAVAADLTESPQSNQVDIAFSLTYYSDAFINGGGEYSDMSGWTNMGSGYGSFIIRSTDSQPEGNYSFRGGTSGLAGMYQDFTTNSTGISDAAIDAGTAELVVEYYPGGFIQTSVESTGGLSDKPRLVARFYNGSGTEIGTALDTGWIVIKDLAGTTPVLNNVCWAPLQELTGAVPVGTRTIRIEMQGDRDYGTNNDARFDGILPYLRIV